MINKFGSIKEYYNLLKNQDLERRSFVKKLVCHTLISREKPKTHLLILPQ